MRQIYNGHLTVYLWQNTPRYLKLTLNIDLTGIIIFE